VRKLAQAFGCRRVTLVGDRGLIKQVGIEALQAKDFYFISPITKAQIETLLKQEGIEMALFDQPLGEVKLAAEADSASAEPPSLRYIFKRNPVRAQELAHNRQLKKAALEKRLHDYNQKLARSRRARLAVARRELLGYLAKLKLEGWLTVRKRRD
jgi:hypothetical protein